MSWAIEDDLPLLHRDYVKLEEINYFSPSWTRIFDSGRDEQNNRMLKKPVNKARESEAPGTYSCT